MAHQSLTRSPTIPDQPLPTPTHGPGGTFTVTCSSIISAPLDRVLANVVDTRTYPSWNTFVPSIDITSQPSSPQTLPLCLAGSSIFDLGTTLRRGTRFVLNVHLNDTRRSNTAVAMSALEDFEHDGRPGVRAAWKLDSWLPGFMLRSECVHEFVEVEDGVVHHRCWETFYGLLASVVRSSVGKSLIDGFGRWDRGLKEHSEKQVQGL